MSEKTIERALSAKEWTEALTGDGAMRPSLFLRARTWGLRIGGADIDGELEPDPADRHAIAAACLHGQAFGFTWEHVDAIMFCLARARAHAGDSPADLAYADKAQEAAVLLEALLPPPEESP